MYQLFYDVLQPYCDDSESHVRFANGEENLILPYIDTDYFIHGRQAKIETTYSDLKDLQEKK